MDSGWGDGRLGQLGGIGLGGGMFGLGVCMDANKWITSYEQVRIRTKAVGG